MNLKEAIEQSKLQSKPFKRPSWGYCLWYEEGLGHYTDGYNGMDCSGISIDEAIADDYELVPNKSKEDHWKAEFIELSKELAGVSGYIPGGLESDPVSLIIYLSARRKAQEEIDNLNISNVDLDMHLKDAWKESEVLSKELKEMTMVATVKNNTINALKEEYVAHERVADAEIERLRKVITSLEAQIPKPKYASHATDEARKKGCTCPPLKGDGMAFDGVSYYCPLHGR